MPDGEDDDGKGALRCSDCGEGNLPEGSAYCLRCGSSLVDPDSYTPEHLEREVLVHRDTVAGERKEVSVLIVDVAGSLAIADSLDPEDVHTMMDGFFALALEAVHREGGTLNQFLGDGFMALFGAPRAHGDDAARSLRAAIEVRDRCRDYAESVRARYGLPFAVRIGVSTGLVWVGSIGSGARRDYTAEGPTVGMASRLESLATPGQILVANATVRRCGGFFDWAEFGPRKLRGLAEPVRVFELLGEADPEARLAERERGLVPFVGRDDELRHLLRACQPGERTSTVEICGEGGIGKSRLVFEALRRLPRGVAGLRMSCRESNAGRAYVPWLELLRHWPEDLAGGDDAAKIVERIEGREGVPPGPQEIEDQLRELLGQAMAQRAVAIVIEDTQWLDPSSRTLIRRLTEEPPPGPVCWIATLRLEGERSWGPTRVDESIRLTPLNPAESKQLAAIVLRAEDDPDDLAELACRRSGGNPLFVEEVARALRDGAEFVRETARLEVTLQESRDRIPDTLHGVVAARIDALPEAGKRLLEAAAVVGEAFGEALLGEVEPALDARPDALVAMLAERGLLRRTDTGEWDFCHGLVREGAYGQLVRERRSTLHHRVAEALAKRPMAETAAGASAVGGHYDLADDPLAALTHLLRAGQAYLVLRAFHEAIPHLRRVIEILRSGTSDAGLEPSVAAHLATALNALDRSGEAAAVLEGLNLEDAPPEDRPHVAMATIQAGWVYFSSENDLERGQGLVERGLALMSGQPDSDEVADMGHTYLARMLSLDGDPSGATVHTRRVVELAGKRGDTAAQVYALYTESNALCDAGRIAEARRTAGESTALAGHGAPDLLIAMAHIAQARVGLCEGDAEGAIATAHEGALVAERAEHIGLQYHATMVSGYAHLLCDEPRAAFTAFEKLAELNRVWPSTQLNLARGHLELGEFDAAAELAEACLAEQPARLLRARAQSVLGLALGLQPGNPRRGEEVLDGAITLFDECGLRPLLAEAHSFMGELLGRRGEAPRAAYYTDRAIQGYEACEMPAHAAQVRARRDT